MSDVNDEVDDLVVEGAVNLMDKVGFVLQQNSQKKEKTKETFDQLFIRFQNLMDLPDEGGDLSLSKRVKLLIKNMFANRDSGWLRTQDMNEAGPKTKKEVRADIMSKLQAEQDKRTQDRRDDYNNDRGNNRDKGGRNQKGGQQYQKKDQGNVKYQKKEPNSPSKKGKGQKEEKVVQIVEIEDDEMGDQLKANFDTFAESMNKAGETPQEGEEAKEEEKEELDFDLYKDLKNKNGKAGDKIFAMLLSKVFDEDTTKVENYLANYLQTLHKQKLLMSMDFVGGLNIFAASLADLALDIPKIHVYMTKAVIGPLMAQEIIDLSKITWVAPPQPKVEDEDEDMIFGNDPFFKMCAQVLAKAQQEGYHIDKICSSWTTGLKAMAEKLDEPDGIWAEIKSEL